MPAGIGAAEDQEEGKEVAGIFHNRFKRRACVQGLSAEVNEP